MFPSHIINVTLEEIEYDAWVEEIGKANNKIIDKFEHFYVEINRGKQVD